MSGNWTPGPWRVSKIGLMNDGAVPVSSEQGQVARVTVQSDFPRGQGHNSECAERDANAHLISAAPDMADALEAALDAWKTHNASGEDMDGDWACDARAALAKARGQS